MLLIHYVEPAPQYLVTSDPLLSQFIFHQTITLSCESLLKIHVSHDAYSTWVKDIYYCIFFTFVCILIHFFTPTMEKHLKMSKLTVLLLIPLTFVRPSFLQSLSPILKIVSCLKRKLKFLVNHLLVPTKCHNRERDNINFSFWNPRAVDFNFSSADP